MTVPAKADPRAAPPLAEEPLLAPGRRQARLAGRVLPPLVFSLVVLGAWQAYTELADISPLLLPSPGAVAVSVVDNAALFARNAVVTLQEILLGFVLGAAAGVALAVLLTYSRLAERAVYPWLVASQMVPIVAVAPILVVWFGFTIVPKVVVVALVCFFPVVVNTTDGLKSVDPEMVRLMRTLGMSRLRIMRSVRVPSALPYVFSGLKVAMALSVIGAVFGEWVGSSEGLGYLMLALNNQLATTELFGAVLVLSLMGISLFFLVGLVERLVIPWHHESRRALQQQ
ncbi:MAG TPA: ABC transporter permease [Actinomycetota bacterium]|nr:ABC transporter permease [Actinomycetota bacterium]